MLKSAQFWAHFLIAWFIAACVLCGVFANFGVDDLTSLGQFVAIAAAYVLSAIMAWLHARSKMDQ
jgi:ABC-type multidrug transport system permease subunit